MKRTVYFANCRFNSCADSKVTKTVSQKQLPFRQLCGQQSHKDSVPKATAVSTAVRTAKSQRQCPKSNCRFNSCADSKVTKTVSQKQLRFNSCAQRQCPKSNCRDSNPRPFDHASGALTTELSLLLMQGHSDDDNAASDIVSPPPHPPGSRRPSHRHPPPTSVPFRGHVVVKRV